MKGYLVDTNILSELRRPKPAPAVVGWISSADPERLFISVLTLGEMRRGVELLRLKDPVAARALHRWMDSTLQEFSERILGIDESVAECWGRLSIREQLPSIDGLLAATASVHDLQVATRNTDDFERSGIACFNPFEFTA